VVKYNTDSKPQNYQEQEFLRKFDKIITQKEEKDKDLVTY